MNDTSRRAAVGLWRLIKVGALLAASYFATSAFAASKLPEVIAILSEAKAKAEGRASRAQACLVKKEPKVLSALISQYDDARNPFNGRIDGWVTELRVHRGKALDDSLEIERLNQALNRIDAFAESVDRALRLHGCGVYKKVIWGKVAALLLTPEMIKVLLEFIRDTSASDKEREHAIRAIEVQKILEWQNVRAVIAFDWKTSEFFVANDITQAVLTRGSTSVYVNEWALQEGLKQTPALTKSLPTGLSSSYKLYTGQLDDLQRYTGKKED